MVVVVASEEARSSTWSSVDEDNGVGRRGTYEDGNEGYDEEGNGK